MSKRAILLVALVLAAWPMAGYATPIATDSFDYAAGVLAGKGSGMDPGWAGPWSGNVAVKGGGSLSYRDTHGNQLATAGNHVQTAPGTVFSYRDLDVPLFTTGRNLYLSFVMDNYNNVGIRWSGISLYHGSQEVFFMGKPGNTTHVGVQVPRRPPIVHRGPFSDPLFFVVILQLVNNGTATQALFFLNPDLGLTTPNGFVGYTNWPDPTIDRIRIAGETGVRFDEFRIGTTYADVSPIQPVPEPGTLLLLGVGLAGLAGIKRKLG